MSTKHKPVKIVTDSAADIPPDVAERLDITVVPLLVNIGGESYRDGVDISGEEFYRRLEATRGVTTTSLPTLASFEEAYRRITSEGAEVVSVHISSKLSGTFNAALIASTADKVPDDSVAVVDTHAVSMATGWVAIRCAEAAKKGKSLEEIEALAVSLSKRVRLFGLLDSLEYVMRSGRVGRVPGTVGAMLNVKPIVTTRPNGEAVIMERIRTRKRALERIVELTSALGPLDALAVLHGADEEGAAQLLEMLKPLNPPQPVIIGHIGAVLGTHIGPKGVGVCCVTSDE